MPLISHEGYPNLILRTNVMAIENVQEFMSGFGHQSNENDTMEEMFSGGVAAYQDFESHGNLQSLELAISKFEALAEMTPENHSSLPDILNNLGTFLRCRFEQFGVLADVDNGIERLEMAVGLTPDGDPEKPSRLGNLGSCLHRRFERVGNMSDLDSAIRQLQLTVNLTPDGHPDKPCWFNNLGISLRRQSERLGDVSDLDSAIRQQQLAVNLTPDGHPDKPKWFNNLGISLRRRSERLGNMSDLDSAIRQQQLAVNLTPDGHPDKPSFFNNLGNSLHRRFERLGEVSDLDSAIRQLQLAVNLTPDGHPDKPSRFNNLGISLQSRFKRLEDVSDIDSAIRQQQLAVNLTPDGHPNKPRWFNNLGISLHRRFERLGDVSDLDSAIRQLQLAVNLTPNEHPDRPSWLINLGSSFVARFRHFRNPHDSEAAITHFSVSAQFPVRPPTIRLAAARQWIRIASLTNHHSLIHAYECTVDLMPVVAWLGLPIRDRHQYLIQMSEIARDAAAAAISLDQCDKALEWLEQGRSVVWNQILQLRTPVDELHDANPDLADRLVQVSRLLDRGLEENESLGSAEHDAQRYRALAIEWESTLKQIRSLPKFEDFLKPMRASRLRDAVQNGPVVVLNIAKERCDALALVPGIEEVLRIPLPDIMFNGMVRLQSELKDQLYSNGIRMRGERAAERWTDEGSINDCGGILAELWNGLVKPVLDSLAFSVRFIFAFTPSILTILSPASARCTTANMVVPNRTTRVPPNTRRRYI
jgi:tetratricopeptide (TPR) repeat protein